MENLQFRIDSDPADYKILVVDDVISNILLLQALLKSEKYQVITANGGQEAIDKTISEVPDLILLDVMMPGLSGFDVSQHLKASAEYKDIPIIFLTALNSHEDIVKGFQLGANDFVTKPFNKNELLIRISHQISLIAAKRIIVKQTEELRNIIVGRDKLYSVIAHDLRGPLGSIKMVLNLVNNNTGEGKFDPEMFEMLKLANQTTEEVFSLLDNLLKWTKSQLGKLQVATQTLDISDILHDGIEIFKTTAELKKISLECHTESCMVLADADMIKTVVRNLLSNALKFSNEDGTILISTETNDEDLLTVSVKDSGCGIKAADKDKLLRTDTHFSTFGTNNEEGSGLGLLLCQDFCIKNGGTLWFDSVEGEGSTFSFSIPKAKL